MDRLLLQSLVLLYFLATLGVGFYKRSNQDVNSFLFAGRKLTIPALVATLVSTWYGGIMEIGRFTYENGVVTWVIFGFFYYIAAFLFVILIAPKIIESNIPTIPELFMSLYGKLPALIAVLCVMLMTTPAPYLKILSELLRNVWDMPEFIALCVGSSLSLAYAFSGGFSAVVRTDKLQFILMFSGFIVLLYFCYVEYGGILFIISQVPSYALSIPGNFSWTFIFTWGFIALITIIDPSFYQRTFSGNSLQTVQNGILISILFWLIFDFLTVLTGLYALAILPTNNSNPYLDLAQLVLPPVAQGLFMVSLIAIVMSTIDSFSFISAFTIGKDLITILKLNHDDNHILRYTRYGLVITSILSIFLAMYYKYAVEIWYMTGSFVVPILLIPLIAALYKVKLTHVHWIMVIPFITSTCWYFYGITFPLEDGHPGYIWTLDPMYPGIIVSLILFFYCRKL